MKGFTQLFLELDATTSTLEKIAAMKKYFKKTGPADSMWAVLILTGRISKRVITSKVLRDLFTLKTQYPEWLFEESYSHVGDTAETLSLLLQSLNISSAQDPEKNVDISLTQWMEVKIPELGKIKDKEEKAELLMSYWSALSADEIFILNKLMTGALRVGVSEKLVIRALGEVYGVASDQIAHRLTGNVSSGVENFEKLISLKATEVTFSQPYPFCLAHAWQDRTDNVWNPIEWCLEWKYDGIRSQVIRREDQVWIWSRGEEDITETFPELKEYFQKLPPGTVIDGEILVIRDGKVQPFQELQKRLGRKKVSAAILKDYPVGFIAYDCLEIAGQDIREKPLRERREHLSQVLSPLLKDHIRISESLKADSLGNLEDLRSQSREKDAEGLMIKSWEGAYTVGRKTGNWWKHKVNPLTLDAVLIYAQAGTGRRANLYTDYTFALWKNNEELIPFAKAYSGLDQKEIDELDQWIRRHTQEKFGPVRSVEPAQVFEIAFEGISESGRHKSGIAVRFPRILRWRKDKKPLDADTLETARDLLHTKAVSP